MFNFIDHFRPIACNFNWKWFGTNIGCMKNGLYFDPITALVWISKAEYLGRHEVNKACSKLRISSLEFDDVLKALYNPNYGDSKNCSLRREIELACDLGTEEAS